MKLGLHLTSGDDAPLLLEVARQADRHGLAALWLPEGDGLFPNPAVTAAAVAVVTRRIGIRAGLALPLHNPVRVAEEWSLVDNLSGGRAGIAFGFSDPRIETVRQLWRGEAVRAPDGEGRPIEIRILPQPVQPELPLWHLLTEPDAEAVSEGRITGLIPAFASVEEGLRELAPWTAVGVDEVTCQVCLADALEALDVLAGILREDRHGR